MCGVALCAATPGLAQAPAGGQQIELETISVEGEAQTPETTTGPVNGYVATKSGTGSKSDTPITEIPQAVSVVGREEIDDRKATKVDEILRYTAGVTAQPFGQDPDTDWFYIRGFDATQKGVFRDGLQLYAYGFGGFQTDPFFLERVDVLKGPASVLYGGANPGGIINLVSKRPNGETFAYAEAGVNNWGNAYFGLDAGGVAGAGNEWSYRFTGRVAGGDQYTDYSEDFRGAVLPQITYQPTDATRITAYAEYATLDQFHSGGSFLPYYGTVRDAPFGKIDRKAYFGERSEDDQDRSQFLIGYEFEHTFDNDWTIQQNARYGRLHNKENAPYTFGYAPYNWMVDLNGNDDPSTGMLHRIGFLHDTEVDTFTVDNRASRDFMTGGLEHSVLFGVDYKYFKIDHVQYSGTLDPISATDPQYTGPATFSIPYLDDVVTQHQVGIYLQDQIRFGSGWLATFNGRYDIVETDQEVRGGFSTPYSSDDGEASGRVGLAYEFANGLTPYVSAATFFNPLIGTSGTPFEPETGHQFEAGVKYAPTFVDAIITASVFDITRQNVVTRGPGALGVNIQIGEVTSKGFEFEAKANVNENLKIIAAFTALDMEITEDANPAIIGNSPFLIPEMTASLWADYKVTRGSFEGVSFGAGLRYNGESWADNENLLKVPDAVLVDAAIRYERDDWGLALNVNNLLDKEYVQGCQGVSTCSWGAARQITLSAHYKW